MRCQSLDRARVGELAHLDVGAAVAQHLDALRARARMARAVHHEIRAEAADDVAHRRDARFGGVCTSSMFTVASAPNLRASLQARLFRRADANHAARAHLLRGGHRQNADRARALDDDGVAPLEAARLDRAVERADARGERLAQRAEAQAHVVGKLVDLRAGQHVEIDVDVLGPAAPQMRRLVEAEIAPVIDRRQALVGVLRIVDAVVAGAARHQRRDHHLRADARAACP